jgi:hypothetical protein
MEYKVLILPNVESLPLKTLQVIEQFVDRSGIVIALERLPEFSIGLTDSQKSDEAVKHLVDQLFRKPKPVPGKAKDLYGLQEPKLLEGVVANHYGEGRTYQIKKVIDRQIWWDKRSSALDPFPEVLRNCITPDFGIDFAYEGLRKNEGLTFTHRKVGDSEFYFICNIQDKTSEIPVTFRTKNKTIRKWNPYTGEISPVLNFSEVMNGVKVPMSIAPYESIFLEFSPEIPDVYVTRTDFNEIKSTDKQEFYAIATQNGTFNTVIQSGNQQKQFRTVVENIPAPFTVSGTWKIELPLDGQAPYSVQSDSLFSWVNNPVTRHFSGTGRYEISFDLPATCKASGNLLMLDLGKVGNVAEVTLNGKKAGTVWMRGQKLDITDFAVKGKNQLEIKVTNALINRVSAMTKAPDIPASLVKRFGTNDKNEGTPREFGFKPLPASGLLGPVQIVAEKMVSIGF